MQPYLVLLYSFVTLLFSFKCILSFNYAEDCGQKIIPPIRFVASSGKKTNIYHAPWVALIQRNDSGQFVNHCTGVIITETHLLSAAHCFSSISRGEHSHHDFRLVMGIDDLSKLNSATIRDILEVKTMPEYRDPAYYYDVAILKFDRVVFDIASDSREIWPICLPDTANDNTDDESRVGHLSRVTAWGKTRYGTDSRFLVSAALEILPNYRCYVDPGSARPELQQAAQAALPRRFDSSVMCAESFIGKEGICSGDSGGPLYIEKRQRNDTSKYYLVGIATGVVDGSCGGRAFPDVFNRIEHSKTLKWVKCAVGLETCPDWYIVVTTGEPLIEESRMTEVINWSQNKSCSTNGIMFPIKLALAAGGVLDGKPTICGGWDGDNTRHECWQLANSKWIPTSYSLKTKRYSHAILILNNTMIITGGLDEESFRLSSTENLKGNKFEDGPDLKVAVSYHCMATFKSKILIIGGNTGNGITDQTWIYSRNMEFIQEGPIMTTKRASHGCAAMKINNKESIIVVGGFNTRTSAEYLDTTTNSWKRIEKKLPMEMRDNPSVLTTPDMNAVIVYEGKVWQAISTDEGVIFEELIQFSSIEREHAVAFLLPSSPDTFQGC